MTISLVELYKTKEVQERAIEMKTTMSIKDLVDKGILIKSFDITHEKNLKGEDAEFIVFKFEIDGDEKHIERTCKSQAWKIRNVLVAITNEELIKQGGVMAMIVADKTPHGNTYSFAGVKV